MQNKNIGVMLHKKRCMYVENLDLLFTVYIFYSNLCMIFVKICRGAKWS